MIFKALKDYSNTLQSRMAQEAISTSSTYSIECRISPHSPHLSESSSLNPVNITWWNLFVEMHFLQITMLRHPWSSSTSFYYIPCTTHAKLQVISIFLWSLQVITTSKLKSTLCYFTACLGQQGLAPFTIRIYVHHWNYRPLQISHGLPEPLLLYSFSLIRCIRWESL